MKKNLLIISLCTLACLLTASCGLLADSITNVYWNTDDAIPLRDDEVLDTLCIIKYSINGKADQLTMHNQKEMDALLYWLIDESKKGNTVKLLNSYSEMGHTRMAFVDEEPLTFSTTENSKAKEWAKKMLLKGYAVEITYDKKSKTYHCIARPRTTKE